MVRHLKDRGTYVLFNTNGTVLNEKNGRAQIEAGLDELRVSLDAATAKSYRAIRGKDYFGRIVKNVRAFRDLQERGGLDRPRVSAWLTGLKETIAELPAFVKVAAEIGVKEVYLQRLVFFENDATGFARPDQALYERMNGDEAAYIEEATRLAEVHGMTFSASGAASEPGMSLKRQDDGSPWSKCRRPWTVMYFTANGRALPCCIAPFSQRGYENYALGDAKKKHLLRPCHKLLLLTVPQTRLRRRAVAAARMQPWSAPVAPAPRSSMPVAAMAGRVSRPHRLLNKPTSWSSWTATGPTILPPSRRWSRRSGRARSIS
jgi:MoaA/NifB/PqqE/SkfB family radical SAM enzyme